MASTQSTARPCQKPWLSSFGLKLNTHMSIIINFADLREDLLWNDGMSEILEDLNQIHTEWIVVMILHFFFGSVRWIEVECRISNAMKIVNNDDVLLLSL